jgi:hypothetical protein
MTYSDAEHSVVWLKSHIWAREIMLFLSHENFFGRFFFWADNHTRQQCVWFLVFHY